MSDNKSVAGEAGRWLRVGFLALTVVGPVVSTIVNRLQERTRSLRALSEQQAGVLREASLKQAEKASELTEELVARGSQLSQSLVESGSKMTSNLLERGSEVTRDLAERGNKASLELSKRGEEAARELGKRGQLMQQELQKRSQEAARELAEHRSKYWTIAGFTLGLLSAGILAYLFIRKRMQPEPETEQHIQLVPEASRTSGAGEIRTSKPQASSSAAPAQEAKPAIAVVEPEEERGVPEGTAFVGIVETKQYYPAKMPLEQITTAAEKPLTVIYFASEDEARAQGYTASK
ncbi:hypothetical protein EPA93_27935 [Ktedonosporobacter rubrisoli]|uniref:Uncharacterized protein n=1 Tax=Ktedonosporobacter rubrisoli TaxID=2509675 RepID=A0A4P6JW61_KTERU|nr:hypothetical protein [Ktedonosporobacter rubrisoli]QBD79600.1 hypothetical protein EPA93_27935 [Ktedonosporobacter rubrisoli]